MALKSLNIHQDLQFSATIKEAKETYSFTVVNASFKVVVDSNFKMRDYHISYT